MAKDGFPYRVVSNLTGMKHSIELEVWYSTITVISDRKHLVGINRMFYPSFVVHKNILRLTQHCHI